MLSDCLVLKELTSADISSRKWSFNGLFTGQILLASDKFITREVFNYEINLKAQTQGSSYMVITDMQLLLNFYYNAIFEMHLISYSMVSISENFSIYLLQ